ncbi:cobalamin biosynthesis protein CobQ [Gymnodinialimonas hymeniacidonis]|uniref:cobalamin biosynthesis protein CobQ n=1 Tax=Gymnodinialimonas hymeniacidonis TaxID=3126508 RepID=UPI0034C6B40B
MNTPAHLIFGAAAFGRPEQRWTLTAALVGAMVPDLSLYLMVGWHLLVLGTEPRIVFDELYFSDTWQTVFAIDNSLILWGALLGVAMWRRWPIVVAFAGAALLHIVFDLPLHAGDGRPHFWPVSDWVFDSRFSYWDSRHGAGWIGPLELAACIALVILLWRRVQSWPWRIAFALLLLAEAGTNNVWRLVF